MQIKDLSRELEAKDAAAVEGGAAVNGAFLFGNGSQLVAGPSLLNVNASPTTVVQNADDSDTTTLVGISTETKNAVANMVGSIGVIGQSL